MRIAVVGKCQFSMFSGSQANATIAVAEMLKLHNHEVTLVSSEAEWWDDVQSMKASWSVVKLEDVKEPFDIAFEVGFMFDSAAQRRAIAKKSIYVTRKHAVMDEIEHSLFPTSAAKRCWESISEIWAFDEFCNNDDVQVLETLSRLPVYRVPYIWTPSIIEKHREETKAPLWLQLTDSFLQEKGVSSVPWTFHIAETNTTSASSCTLPTLIVRELSLKKTLDVKLLRIHNADHVNKSKFFQDNIWRHSRVEDLSGDFVGRQRVIDWVFEPMSCVITHQRFNPFRPMLFDLAWVGIPFIHNSEFFKELGNGLEKFYYKDNRITEAITCLENINNDFNKRTGYFNIESINGIRKGILEKVSPFSSINYKGWGDCLQRFLGMEPVQPPIPPVYITPTHEVKQEVNQEVKQEVNQEVNQEVKLQLTVGFSDMWDSFNPEYNFFTLLLEEAGKHLTPPLTIKGIKINLGDAPPDLLVFGPFGNVWTSFPESQPKAHFTGENTPPFDVSGVHLNMCFPHTDMISDKYIRLPLWILEIDWFGADPERIVNPKPIPLDRCIKTYPEELVAKKKFCAFIVSNPKNELRNSAFHWLSSYKPVDSAGALFNNVGPILAAGPGGGGGELKKLEFLKDYKFCITYENSASPGYVTEKLLHAKAAGCVPIYWGDPKVNRDFNPAGFIDARDCRTAAELIEEVSRVDKDDELWLKMASQPALDTYKLEWTRRTLSHTASKLLALGLKRDVKLPRFLGASTSDEANMMRLSRAPAPIQKNSTTVETPILVTFVTRRFLPSLQLWLSAINAQKVALPNLEVRIYYGEDIPVESIIRITETYNFVNFRGIPFDSAPATFKDMWEPQHFVWKIWIYNTLANDETLAGRMIFYMDAGCFMCRWPTDWMLKAQASDICFLEDGRQTNEQWCHATFCQILNVTQEEKKSNQIVAGILIFRAGAEKVKQLFSHAWALAQNRAIIVGDKWAGQLSDGRLCGHRHDQSILSILSQRYKCERFPLDFVYCDESLRKTHQTGRSIYCHRGNFKIHKQFTDGIDECYIINLDRRVDRMNRLYSTTPELKERATRFSAIEGKKLELTPTLARLFRPHDFLWKKAIMGCALSHLSLWWKLANDHQDIDNFLILEDDVKLKPDWEASWLKAKPHLPEDWDVVYLGGILPPNRAGFDSIKERVNEHFSQVGMNTFFGQNPPNRYFHWCAYAYVLSRRGACKILEILHAHDGYWTSADHMICNPVNQIRMYFLDPLVAGCYQDDDPKYASSAFNDFNRVDSFDSDLWNNDERFNKETVEQYLAHTKNHELDIALALKEAKNMMIHVPVSVPSTATLTVPLIEPLITPKPTKNRLVCLTEHNLDISLLYEKDWIFELFGKPTLLPIDKVGVHDPPPLGETPIVVMQRPWPHKYNLLLQRWSQAGGKFYIFHLSDEHCTDDISAYILPGCLKVVRMYDRADLTPEEREKCVIIPLGYHWTMRGGGVPYPIERTPRLPFRGTRWSFFGTNWKQRAEKFAPIMSFEPNRCKFLDSWNAKNGVGYDEYIGALLDTVFVPCPGGNNVETYRFYEAMECGCVPVVVREPGDELFVKMITENLPIVPVKNWEEANALMQQLFADKNLLENYRANILNAWRVWKEKLTKQVKDAFQI